MFFNFFFYFLILLRFFIATMLLCPLQGFLIFQFFHLTVKQIILFCGIIFFHCTHFFRFPMQYSTYLTVPTILSALSLLCRLSLYTHAYPVSTEQLTQFHSGAHLPRSRGIFQNHCKCSSGLLLHPSDCSPCKTGCAGIGHTLLENGSGLCVVLQDSCSSVSASFLSFTLTV